jgi:hypothetical protein
VRGTQIARCYITYCNADQDHLGVAKHLRDAEEDAQQDRHELGETGRPHVMTLRNKVDGQTILTYQPEEDTRPSSVDYHRPNGLRRREGGVRWG